VKREEQTSATSGYKLTYQFACVTTSFNQVNPLDLAVAKLLT